MNEMQYKWAEAWYAGDEDGSPVTMTVEQSPDWVVHFETDDGMLTIPWAEADLQVQRLKRLYE